MTRTLGRFAGAIHSQLRQWHEARKASGDVWISTESGCEVRTPNAIFTFATPELAAAAVPEIVRLRKAAHPAGSQTRQTSRHGAWLWRTKLRNRTVREHA